MSVGTDLARIAAKRKKSLVTVARESLIELGTNVITGTPVDKGAAQGNWNSAYGTADESTRANVVGAGASIGSLESKLRVLGLGDLFYMTNGLPYIRKLEYGSSEQAPSGMLRVNVVNWQDIVARRARAEHGR
jgi:hypothetical protein